MSTQITAGFTFDSWDEEVAVEAEGIRVVRTTFVKRFVGGIEGSSRGEMLMAHAPEDSAAYTGFELVQGTAADRSGSFVLSHHAVMAGGTQSLDIVVLPGSGSGDFAGVSGTAAIERHDDGSHTFTLDIEVPGEG